jgi:hypothetical protein
LVRDTEGPDSTKNNNYNSYLSFNNINNKLISGVDNNKMSNNFHTLDDMSGIKIQTPKRKEKSEESSMH